MRAWDLGATASARASGRVRPAAPILEPVPDAAPERTDAGLAAELRQARELAHVRFEQSPVPQVQWDAEGRLTDVNLAFCELLGRPAADLVGRPAADLLHRSDTPDAPDAPGASDAVGLLPVTATGPRERVLRGAGSQPIPAVVSGTVLRGPDGACTGMLAAVQDLAVVRRLAERRERQESFFLTLAQRAGDLALVTDTAGLVLYTSPAAADLLGWAAEDLVDLTTTEHLHDEDRASALSAFDRVRREGTTATVNLRVRVADGAWRWLEATTSNLIDTAVGGVLWNLRDVDDRVQAEAALRASESRYRAIADTAEEGLWVCDPAGRTAYVNQRLLEILGLDGDAVSERSVLDLLPLAHGARIDGAGWADRRSERYEVGYLHPDGRRRTLRVSLAPLDDAGGTVEGSLAMISDVTDARLLEEQLRRAALHDGLTGLPNRALLFDRLQHALRRETTGTAVLLVDLDRFAHVNDGWGHAVADELLVRVAGRLQGAVRPTDTVARIAGDEFLLVCEDVAEAEAHRLAGELLTALGEPHDVAGGRVRLTASVGVATSPSSAAEDLLRHAETAMHAAKAAGRHRFRVFDSGLAGSDEVALGADLRRALEDGDLRLHHQPVVDLATGRVVGVEALARWHHPRHGDVAPDRFVAVAEQLGLAPDLDRWALGRALADARALQDAGALATDARLAVNVSAYSLGDPDLDRWVAAAVEAAGFEPADVLLEVTESAVMADASTAIAVLTRLRDRGFGIAVDDFGTGHSSLAYLHQLPATVLKVDRSFVADLASDPSALAIAGSIVELARAVGLTVVAEGVETSEQADLLRTLGCDAAQGWRWSRAVSPEEARDTGALTRSYDVCS